MRVGFEVFMSHLEEPLRAQNLSRLLIMFHKYRKSSQSARFLPEKIRKSLDHTCLYGNTSIAKLNCFELHLRTCLCFGVFTLPFLNDLASGPYLKNASGTAISIENSLTLSS